MLFRHLGKNVFTINADPNPSFKVDFFGDYLDLGLDRQFDCTGARTFWSMCETPAAFSTRCLMTSRMAAFWLLACRSTNSTQAATTFTMGHHNRYNALLLIYQLVCAGFDCSGDQIALKIYNRQMSVILAQDRTSFRDRRWRLGSTWCGPSRSSCSPTEATGAPPISTGAGSSDRLLRFDDPFACSGECETRGIEDL